MITGATRVAAVIGDPVRHSLSPRLHNAAYRALELDWRYVAFEVPAGGAPGALAAVRALRLVGLSVTMPHKHAVVDLCDDVAPEARALGSVNTVTLLDDGRLAGESTDGPGFLRALAAAGVEPAAGPALVLGAGGAARAVALALAGCGAPVSIAARRPEAAAGAISTISGSTVAGATVAGPGVAVAWSDRRDAAAAAALVVNATPAGMAGSPEPPLPADAVGAGHVVVDLVYHPLETELLRAARARGAQAVSGLGMLVHQAALQVERWTGRPAPVDAMLAAVADLR